MKKFIFKGCGTAIVTPFTDDGINFYSLRNLLEFQISEGTDSIIVCGTTGEAATMTLQEKKDVIRFTVETVNKRVPVIAGVGSNCTSDCIQMCKYAQELGVDGLLIVTPYYNKTTQQGIIAHYSAIAKSTALPIILYNVPSRTGLNMLPNTCFELSKIENIVGIKEASGNISQIAEISALCEDNLYIYSGNDDQILPVLAVGGIGVISVLANIAPKKVHNMVYDFFNGKQYSSILAQLEAIPIIKALFSEVNPIPVKSALNFMEFNVGNPRLPLLEMSSINKDILKKEMINYGLIVNIE